MNNLHRYARARADLYKYAFIDRISAGLLGKKKDTTQPFNGIRFTSHPSGTYDLNNHLAAQAEHAAVKHAVHTAGLVPKRQATEDRQEYDQNVNKLTHVFMNHIRQHVHGNPNDQLTNYYLQTADKMKVPDDPSLPKTPGQPLEYRAPLPVGVRDLSTAVMPLVRKTAEDLNLRPKSTVLLPEEPSHLPKAGDELDLDGGGDENNYIDLLDPQFDEEHPDATENRIATELHKIPDVGARRLGEFGSGKPAYEVLSDPSEQDFNFEMPQVEGLEGPTPDIQEIESHKPRAPRAKPNVIPAQKRQEMYQAIADTMKNSPIAGLSERVVKMLREAYGLSARQANSMFESYKKIGMGNKGQGPPKQKPTGRKTVPEDKYGLARRGPRVPKIPHPEDEHAELGTMPLDEYDTVPARLRTVPGEMLASTETAQPSELQMWAYGNEARSRAPAIRLRNGDRVVVTDGPHKGKRGIAGMIGSGEANVQFPNDTENGRPLWANIPHKHLQLDDDEPNQLSRLARVRYAAYRAPAGGIAVRGTFYKGGSLIPDMEGSFMKPKSKLNPAKLSALKARMKFAKAKVPLPHPEDKGARLGITPLHRGDSSGRGNDMVPGEMIASPTGASERDLFGWQKTIYDASPLHGRLRLSEDDDVIVTGGEHAGKQGRIRTVFMHAPQAAVQFEDGTFQNIPMEHLRLNEELSG